MMKLLAVLNFLPWLNWNWNTTRMKGTGLDGTGTWDPLLSRSGLSFSPEWKELTTEKTRSRLPRLVLVGGPCVLPIS